MFDCLVDKCMTVRATTEQLKLPVSTVNEFRKVILNENRR